MVIDDYGKCILEGFRSPDNCCTLTSPLNTRHKIGSNDTKLWHKRLWHLNYKSLKKLSDVGAVHGLPKIGTQISGVCGPWQLKTTHKVVQYTSTAKVLELLHMDHMGPMQVESIANKIYFFVCVDNFSRFTWVYFIREKSDTFESFRNLCIKLKNEKIATLEKLGELEVIMEKNLKIIFFLIVVTSIEFLMSFPPPRHHNKLVLLR